MMSFLASLGWNDGTEQEIFTKEELIKKFKLDRVQNRVPVLMKAFNLDEWTIYPQLKLRQPL